MIPPSLLNFISGLAAGAGINLLTSISGGPGGSKSPIVVDSAVWVAAAGFVAYSAHIVEAVERDAALVIDSRLTRAEKEAVLRDEMLSIRWRYRTVIGFSALSLITAVLLIPGLGIW